MDRISDERLEQYLRYYDQKSAPMAFPYEFGDAERLVREVIECRKTARESHDDLRSEVAELRRRIAELEARPVGGYPYPVYVPCEPSPWRVTWTNTTSTTGQPIK